MAHFTSTPCGFIASFKVLNIGAPEPVTLSTRRATCSLEKTGVAVFAAAAAGAVLLTCQPSIGAITAPECFNGVGPGCDAQAEQSPLVRELLEKSRVNREKNERDTLEKYWNEGYKSYFSFGYDRNLVRKDDGTYVLERPDSLIAKALRSLGVDVPSQGLEPRKASE